MATRFRFRTEPDDRFCAQRIKDASDTVLAFVDWQFRYVGQEFGDEGHHQRGDGRNVRGLWKFDLGHSGVLRFAMLAR